MGEMFAIRDTEKIGHLYNIASITLLEVIIYLQGPLFFSRNPQNP